MQVCPACLGAFLGDIAIRGKAGMPFMGSAIARAVRDTLNIDTILDTIIQTELTAKDAARIISALRSRDLIEYALMKDAPGAEGLVSFLRRFWNYKESPYVREKLHLHTHRNRNEWIGYR